ncbi:glycosyl transferase [bacterium (Candidatus Gribaldobacteria) CG07_land_8_20_14_0_80_33_18]|uniref:Glycosyl transferase n=1 Tax=bacterium (Candidatus Gribaldobacteria) CG07_land_8_20_14_0_80_33_18 TaxID=2014272 RepID=A0A2M6Z2I1_9BACT|nr:MAG: glycosyl transferase [bacterium (Candidatus Gribaldobacteria) CG07_land_8_20_14_0_80_33_18]
MKIALIAPLEESIPPKKYGGTELIVSLLAEGLIKKGHKVYLFASGDSKTKANLIPIFKRALRKEKFCQDLKIREALKFIGVGKIVNKLKRIKVDIIHNHLGWRFLPFAEQFKSPTITTLHGPLDSHYSKFIYSKFKDYHFVSISNSQRKPLKLNYLATVYNGIDISQFDFNSFPKGNYLAFLGRMSPEKGPLEAIKIAKKTKLKLKMAAKIDVVDKEYFEKSIKPLIDKKQIEFIGEIGPKEKNNFLKNATALLCPLQWEEPFGLFMAEAMACGTPVIVLNRGSAKEVVKDKKTGFVVDSLDDMAKAIKNINQIKRENCRKWVEEKFTAEKMVNEYEKVYYKIL